MLSGSKIDEFCTGGKAIWVKNKTGTVLLIDMPSNQGPVQLRIGPGQEPFSVSDYFPPDMIRQASVLRRLVSEGKLILMDPEDPILKGRKSASPVKSLAGEAQSAADRAEQHGKAKIDVDAALDPDLEEIEASPKVSFLCDAILQGDVKESLFESKITEIQSHEELTEKDLTYIISQLKGKDKIIEWATNALASLREATENDDDGDEPGVSAGTEEELEESAKELLARSRVRGNNIVGEPGPAAVKTESVTMSAEERRALKKTIITK
jgi:hypothetical protein